jgi:hypothetical protein
MAEATANATPPATSGGLTKDEVTAIVAESLKSVTGTLTELAKNQKVLADTLAAQAPAADAKKSLSAEDVQKLVADGVRAATEQQQQTAEQKAAREAFIKDEKNGLAKLPAAYVGQLGPDPTKWAEQAKAITETFKADFTAAGGKVENVGGAAREGGDASGEKPAANKKFSGLAEGTEKFASEIKIPTA